MIPPANSFIYLLRSWPLTPLIYQHPFFLLEHEIKMLNFPASNLCRKKHWKPERSQVASDTPWKGGKATAQCRCVDKRWGGRARRWDQQAARTMLAVTVLYFTECAVLQTEPSPTPTCNIWPVTGTSACLGRDNPEGIELGWKTDTPEH